MSKHLEVWAGLECTVSRVHDRYSDQILRTGHHDRIADLDLFASLNISSLRYPVLWERTAPSGHPDWKWPDERLQRLRALRVNPIVGLLHHGSGPPFTSLVDPEFPNHFRNYARQVAERYPWVRDYTPINEPLTTARFSGLYGHWYPHGKDELTAARALLIQCRAIVLAMRAIRRVNPAARLVQTEDIGKVFSTPALADQAYFENERRWLLYDLLCGRLQPADRMWRHLRWVGISEADLYWFQQNACPPDILGINHYVTSDRFLDENVRMYPAHTHGGNGKQRYADVEAVRVSQDLDIGLEPRLQEMWDRYRRPMAVTEAHLGCTEDEQVRWLWEIWQGAVNARNSGVDVRAVTVWSLLGAYDWDCLLAHENGHYEPGVYDVASGRPRPTDLVPFVRRLAHTERDHHPVLSSAGWWRRPERVCYCINCEDSTAVPVVLS